MVTRYTVGGYAPSGRFMRDGKGRITCVADGELVPYEEYKALESRHRDLVGALNKLADEWHEIYKSDNSEYAKGVAMGLELASDELRKALSEELKGER